jgi:hypothetical protein
VALYSFDTIAFIESWHRRLPPATFPTFWERLDVLINGRSVQAVDEVREEVARRDDELKQWLKTRSHLFVPLEPDIQQATRTVLERAERLVGAGSGRSAADPFVIALALARAGVVVTEEQRRGPNKIPAVCDGLGVRCLSTVEFIQEQGWIF